MPKLTEEDDIVSYLTMFERLMTAFEVQRERWAFKLASHLSGRAQKAYAALSSAEAGDYRKLKEAILRRYDITDESYCQRFQSGKRGKRRVKQRTGSTIERFGNKVAIKSKESCAEVMPDYSGAVSQNFGRGCQTLFGKGVLRLVKKLCGWLMITFKRGRKIRPVKIRARKKETNQEDDVFDVVSQDIW